jgi:hypothetical protein
MRHACRSTADRSLSMKTTGRIASGFSRSPSTPMLAGTRGHQAPGVALELPFYANALRQPRKRVSSLRPSPAAGSGRPAPREPWLQGSPSMSTRTGSARRDENDRRGDQGRDRGPGRRVAAEPPEQEALDAGAEPEQSRAHMTFVIPYRLSLCAYVILSLAAILPLPRVLAFWFTPRLSWCLVL